MDKSKKVSVIMAAFNCEKTVGASVESILNQTYDNIEFIICDDGSADRTYEILEGYKEKYPDKIVLLKNEVNMKLPRSLNRCIENVTGDYVARMDADDVSKPNRFEVQVEFLQTHPEYDLVSTGVEIFDGEKICGYNILPEFPTARTQLTGNAFSHETIMTYPYVYRELNGYNLDKRAVRVEDLDLWFRFFAKGYKGYGIQEVYYTALEDRGALKRRKYRYRFNSTVTRLRGFRRNKIPFYLWYKAFKPMIIGLVPSFLYKPLHRRGQNKSLKKNSVK